MDHMVHGVRRRIVKKALPPGGPGGPGKPSGSGSSGGSGSPGGPNGPDDDPRGSGGEPPCQITINVFVSDRGTFHYQHFRVSDRQQTGAGVHRSVNVSQAGQGEPSSP